MKLENCSLETLRSLLEDATLSPMAVTQYFLDRIDVFDRQRVCFHAVRHEDALAAAVRAESFFRQSSTRQLTGIPVALSEDIPSYATLARKLTLYGVVFPGFFKAEQWEILCQKKLAPAAIGTGTSLLRHAGQAGLTGFIPTPGVISRHGLASEAPPVGFVAKNAGDCAALLDALSDYDPLDPAMPQIHSFQYGALIGAPVKGLRVWAEAEHGLCGRLAALECAQADGDADCDVRVIPTNQVPENPGAPVITLTDTLSLMGKPFEEETLLGLHAALTKGENR